jgi:hypothetical protein
VPRLVEFTVTVEPPPKQGEVAEGDVKLDTSAIAFTLNDAVLAEDTLLLQPDEVATDVTVNVVAPVEVSCEDGMVNVPFDEPIVRAAVPPVTELAPARL